MAEVDELMELHEMVPPLPVVLLPPEWVAEHRGLLEREVSGTRIADPAARRPKRRRGRVAVLALLPAALIGGAVAYSVSAHRTAGQLGNFVTCFAVPKLEGASAGTSFTGPGDLATFCNQAWESGSITAPPPGPAPSSWVACVSDQEGVDVFPGNDPGLCDLLGLQPVPPDYYERSQQFSSLQGDLFSLFPDTGCESATEASTTTRQVLNAHGYSTWKVRTGGFGELTPCALTPDIDAVNGVATVNARVRPELLDAVQQGLQLAGSCGPEDVLLSDVRQSMSDAGFGDWTVTVDHPLSTQWPCVSGFNTDPASKSIVLTGHATG
jgi:hypothetical protein